MNPKIKIALIAVGGLAVAGLIGYFAMNSGSMLKGDTSGLLSAAEQPKLSNFVVNPSSLTWQKDGKTTFSVDVKGTQSGQNYNLAFSVDKDGTKRFGCDNPINADGSISCDWNGYDVSTNMIASPGIYEVSANLQMVGSGTADLQVGGVTIDQLKQNLVVGAAVEQANNPNQVGNTPAEQANNPSQIGNSPAEQTNDSNQVGNTPAEQANNSNVISPPDDTKGQTPATSSTPPSPSPPPVPAQPEPEISKLAISPNPFDLKGGTVSATISFILTNLSADMTADIVISHLNAKNESVMDVGWSIKNVNVKQSGNNYSLVWVGDKGGTSGKNYEIAVSDGAPNLVWEAMIQDVGNKGITVYEDPSILMTPGNYTLSVKVSKKVDNNMSIIKQLDFPFVIKNSGKPVVVAPAPRPAPKKIPVVKKK